MENDYKTHTTLPAFFILHFKFYIFSNYLLTNEKIQYILSRLTKKYILRGVAQLVARHIWDVDAAGSTPVTPTKIAVSTFVGTAIFFVFDSKESNLMEKHRYNHKSVHSIKSPPDNPYQYKTVAFFLV